MTVSVADSRFIRQMLQDESCIVLGDDKEYLIEARLGALARREGLDSVGELISLLRGGELELRDDVVGALATNETWFFRDLHPFEALHRYVIPTILAAGGGSLSMWSAAASTGQEAYSLALLVLEHFPGVPHVTILGSDLSSDVLDQARAGLYNQVEINRGLPVSLLVKYFSQQGTRWQLHERVRAMVTFRQLNLARPLPAMATMDIVFLRNVLIYFEPVTRAAVLEHVVRVLNPGGYLFLGNTETTYGLGSSFQRVQFGKTTCYQLKDGRQQ
jgi:chemotaxis protein methyltransferase CheR